MFWWTQYYDQPNYYLLYLCGMVIVVFLMVFQMGIYMNFSRAILNLTRPALSQILFFDSVRFIIFFWIPRSEADDINIIQRFLVAKSLCDCSIMISYKKITFPSSSSEDIERVISLSKNSSQSAILKLSDGLYLLISMTVVDTDPKLSSKVPHHIKQHCKIRDWWHKEFP